MTDFRQMALQVPEASEPGSVLWVCSEAWTWICEQLEGVPVALQGDYGNPEYPSPQGALSEGG